MDEETTWPQYREQPPSKPRTSKMANANTINFQPAVKAKAELEAMAKAAQVTEPVQPMDPVEPKAGDMFTPEKGKKGQYHQLQTGPLVRIVTH